MKTVALILERKPYVDAAEPSSPEINKRQKIPRLTVHLSRQSLHKRFDQRLVGITLRESRKTVRSDPLPTLRDREIVQPGIVMSWS